MATRDKDVEIRTSEKKPDTMEAASAYRPDPAHIKRHDEEHQKDMDLAAMLQAKWSRIADEQHSTH